MSLQHVRSLPESILLRILPTLLVWLLTASLVSGAHAQSTLAPDISAGSATNADNNGAIRLRSTPQQRQEAQTRDANGQLLEDERLSPSAPPAPRYVPGEFERFVQKQAGPAVEIRRFGADLITGTTDGRGAELSPLVPAEYIVAPGDEVLLTLWGSVDADLRLIVDRSGRISIPRVGAVQVSGVRHGDLQNVVNRRVAQVFKNFESSVTLGQLRGIRVFVTGFVTRPGAYTVTSLSTVVGALMRAGGPAASGSYRNVELRRVGRLVANFDLYDLLLKGDRSADQIVQAGDVVHVGAVGTQVGIIGSVNKPTVLELKAGETIADVLRIAGGLSAVADRSRLAVERLQERNAARVAQIELPGGLTQTLSHGDVLRAFSAVDVALPIERQSKRVRVEGEVMRPAEYVLPEGSSVHDALRAAGGFTPAAYVFATEFTRVSVEQRQQEAYDRALRDLEVSLARASTSRRVTSAEEASVVSARLATSNELIARMRTLRPTGRVVLELPPDSRELPNLALEDGDRIYVPARPTAVGVFGSVYNAGTYLYTADRKVSDYLRVAGGPTKGADEGSVFLIRANGSVVSATQQNGSWFSRGTKLDQVPAQPGDTVFVPEELDKTTLVQHIKDWTQILSQFGLGVAAIKVLGD